jgi:hypothetical protein
MIDWDLRSGKPAHKFDAGHVNSILLHGPDQEQIISGSDGTGHLLNNANLVVGLSPFHVDIHNPKITR